MALNKNALGTAIKDKIKAVSGLDLSAADESAMEDLWQAIAEAVVDHIKNNAEVTTTVASGIAVQVTPATGTGTTTGTGTGTGTIS